MGTDGASPSATAQPEQRTFSPAVAISNHMVKLLANWVGRGPTKARTTLNPNLVVVTFGDTMTRAESNLVATGAAAQVRNMRRIFHTEMREEAISGVEALLDRKVVAYMSDIDTDANVAMMAFVLEPPADSHSVEMADPAV
jgi:uncharacterized protein YbcI